jgi:hypothetical protein
MELLRNVWLLVCHLHMLNLLKDLLADAAAISILPSKSEGMLQAEINSPQFQQSFCVLC